MFNGLLLNPAYAGSRDHASGTLLARSQWVGFPGAPKTQTASLHAPSADLKHGFGMTLFNDEIGPIAYTGLGAQYAYRILLDKNSSLALGLDGTLAYYRTDYTGLNVEDGGDQILTGNDIRKWLPNAGFGVWYQRERMYIGASVPRLIRNNLVQQVTDGDQAKEYRHAYLTAGWVADLSDKVKFRPSALLKAAPGSGPQLDLNASFLFAEKLWAGVSWRTEDAVVFLAEFWPTKQLRLGYAYDLNTSRLRTFNGGSHELMLGFDFSFQKGRVVSPRYF
jgi:type IX secretion system PorP/SprF family membrane protein